MVSYFKLAAEKKDTIFGAAIKIFDPSYFVMALTSNSLDLKGEEKSSGTAKYFSIYF